MHEQDRPTWAACCVLLFPTSPPTKLQQQTSQGKGKAAEKTTCPGAEGSGDRRVSCLSEGKTGILPPRTLPQNREGERMGERMKQSEGGKEAARNKSRKAGVL